MKKLQILMPMAGAGSRFANQGYATPKPLIQVDGMPMFLKALSSIEDIGVQMSYFFVIRQEHVDTQNLDRLIKEELPEANIIIIPEVTKGAAETAYLAKPFLDPESALIIMDCDLWFKSPEYENMVRKSFHKKNVVDGGLLTFESRDPRYSYAEIQNNNEVTRTAEKQVISHYAITGAYFFSRTKFFTIACEELFKYPISKELPEYYLSLLYNILIKRGCRIQAAKVESFASFGTPEELKNYHSSIAVK